MLRGALSEATRLELWQVFSGEDIKAALIAPGRPLVVVNIEKSERYLQWLFVDDDGAYAVETYKLDHPPAGFVNPAFRLNLSELRKITSKARMPTNARGQVPHLVGLLRHVWWVKLRSWRNFTCAPLPSSTVGDRVAAVELARECDGPGSVIRSARSSMCRPGTTTSRRSAGPLPSVCHRIMPRGWHRAAAALGAANWHVIVFGRICQAAVEWGGEGFIIITMLPLGGLAASLADLPPVRKFSSVRHNPVPLKRNFATAPGMRL